MAAAYRADQVGSFLRSDELKQAHTAAERGELPRAQLRAIEDREILRVLDLQRQVGMPIFTDGEYRRGGWSTDFAEAVDGFVPGTPPVVMTWHDSAATPHTDAPPQTAGTGTATPSGRIIGERLRPRRRLTAHEVEFLKQHAPGPIKMTMPAPSYVVTRGYKPGVTDRVYADRSEVLREVAGIVQQEVSALVADGVAYIQLDNPHYPDYISDERRQQWQALGVDSDRALAEDIQADNSALQGVDRTRVRLAMHLCRGNGPLGRWHTAGGYERIAEQVFGQVDVDRFLLEYDSERAGGFEPLRFVPPGKTVVLGLITTKSPALESQDVLLRRLDEASQYVPMDNLALSPQCGFASTLIGNPLTWDDQRRKLELVVDTARKAWG
jgi:5-methyltetrahydropteroyltriglutamate--homocysteine methyltransferase